MNILYFSFIYLLFHLYLSIYFYIIYNSYLEFYVFHFYLLISLSLSIYLSMFLFIYSCCFELKISTFPKHSEQNACFKNRLRTHNMGILFIRPTGYSGSVLHAQLDAFVCTYLPVSALLLFATKIDEAALARGIIAGCRFVMSLNPHKSTNSAYYSRNSSYYSPMLTVFYRTPGTHEPANSPTRIFH